MLTTHKIQSFNTQRLYTKAGQRIAWTVLRSGNVSMADADRCIDRVLVIERPPGTTPSNAAVMHAYDHNRYAAFDDADQDEHEAVKDWLYRAAERTRSAQGDSADTAVETLSTNCRRHTPVRVGEVYMFSRAVAETSRAYNRAAHGGITYTEECSVCKARREVNKNGCHFEFGPWQI